MSRPGDKFNDRRRLMVATRTELSVLNSEFWLLTSVPLILFALFPLKLRINDWTESFQPNKSSNENAYFSDGPPAGFGLPGIGIYALNRGVATISGSMAVSY